MAIPVIVVHGGAGRRAGAGPKAEAYRQGLADAATAGMAALAKGLGPVEACEQAVRWMEACGAFNAGVGSCLTLARTIECDAAIMRGNDRAAGACGGVPGVAFPVSLARCIMEQTDHMLLVGEQAQRFAQGFGLEPMPELDLADRLQRHEHLVAKKVAEAGTGAARFQRLIDMLRHGGECDTVGAVAIDSQGRLAAAVSTGGLWLKLPGRVGDSSVVGAGLHCDDRAGSASATGVGEAIMTVGLSRLATDHMRNGICAQEACERAIAVGTAEFGDDTMGIIGLDPQGRVGVAMNTAAMGRAYMAGGMSAPSVAIGAQERLIVDD